MLPGDLKKKKKKVARNIWFNGSEVLQSWQFLEVKSNPEYIYFFVYSSCKLSVPESAWTAAHKGQLYKND